MTVPSQDLIDRLGTAATECRDLIREAHAATKDLRQATREAAHERELWTDLADHITDEAVKHHVNAKLREAVDEVAPACQAALDAAVERVQDQFEAFTQLLYQGRRQGRDSRGDWRDLIDPKHTIERAP